MTREDAIKKLESDDKNFSYADLTKKNLAYFDFCEADLREASLYEADLYGADLYGADLREASLYEASLYEASLYGADLRGADLRGADLRGADLRGADIDYACWPLWCGGLHVKIDKRIACQLAYHFCAQDCDDPEYIAARNAILSFANQFHRAEECGLLEPGDAR